MTVRSVIGVSEMKANDGSAERDIDSLHPIDACTVTLERVHSCLLSLLSVADC